MRRNICIAHLVNSSRDSNELKLFEPSRRMGRGERVLSEARVVIPAMSELSAAIAVQERIKLSTICIRIYLKKVLTYYILRDTIYYAIGNTT